MRFRIALTDCLEHADATHPLLLRARSERPRGRAAEQRDELAASFDHLVGSGKERRRYGEPEHAGGFGVDDEFELRCLHHGQVRGLRALENATYIDADLAIGVDDIGPIAN